MPKRSAKNLEKEDVGAKKRRVSPDGGEKKKKEKKEKRKLPASEALLGITKLEDTRVRIELAPGWESVLPQQGEDDPGCLIMWDYDNVAGTVAAINNAAAGGGGPAPPGWLNLAALGGGPITVPHLMTAVLAHVQITGGGGGLVGNALIAPNTVQQYGNVTTIFNNVGFEPFFMAHAVCPIGRHYVLADRRQASTAVADPIATPPAGLGVGVFA